MKGTSGVEGSAKNERLASHEDREEVKKEDTADSSPRQKAELMVVQLKEDK